MSETTPAAGFPLARPARDRYRLDESLITDLGHVTVGDPAAARRVALAMNAVRDAARFPELAVRAGELHGAGLLREIATLLVEAYKEQEGADVFDRALRFVAAEIGAEPVEGTMLRFVREFPPPVVYRGEEAPERWLPPRRVLSLEELMLLWLSNRNPAFSRFRELFHDGPLRDATVYEPAIDALDRFLAARPGEGAGGASLLALLEAPARVCPTSIEGQLEYVRTHWAGLFGGRLGALMDRLLRGLDLLREERKPGGPGHGPPEVLDAAALAARGGEDEAFSADRSWMPRVVLLAKSTHVWLDQLAREHRREVRRLDQVPDEELDRIAAAGFTALWLIGVWERSEASRRIKRMRGDHDADASAYALRDYVIAADLGGEEAWRDLHDRAARRGIRLASDMVPNHVGIDGRWVVEHPDRFLSLREPPFPGYSFGGEDLSGDPRVSIRIEDHYWDGTDAAVVFQRVDNATGDVRYIYHGNDGTSMPWNDTAQLDYLNPETREAVIRTILHVARMFPVIRFDAAMTLAKRHIHRLWYPEPGSGGAIPSRAEHGMSSAELERLLPREFWREVVDRVAAEAPDTLLLAEAFWLMEGYFVRTLGVHRVYNSAFMHMTAAEDNAGYHRMMRDVLEFDPEVLKRFVNFMSNPDEETAIGRFGREDKYFGVATLLATLPGLPMFAHGQVEGFTEKYGMEFRRARRQEEPDAGLVDRHRRDIFPLLHRRAQFAGVEGFLLYDTGCDDVFAYSNRADGAASLVLYHNRYARAEGSADGSVPFRDRASGTMRTRRLAEGLGLRAGENDVTILREHRSGLELLRRSRELAGHGFRFALEAYECRVYLDVREVSDPAGEWVRLADRLGGAGVPSAEEALEAMRLEPLHAALRDVVTAAVREDGLEEPCARLRTEAGRRGIRTEAAPGAEAVPGAIESAVRAVSDLSDLPDAAGDGLPAIEWRRAVAAALVVLGGLEADPDSWQGLSGVRDACAGAGLPGNAERAARLVVLLARRNGGARSDDAAPDAGLLADPEARSVLEVHEHGGVHWFRRDAFEDLRAALFTAALVRARTPEERERAAARDRALAEAGSRSGDRFDALLAAWEESAAGGP